jgi:hypothetical protein
VSIMSQQVTFYDADIFATFTTRILVFGPLELE